MVASEGPDPLGSQEAVFEISRNRDFERVERLLNASRAERVKVLIRTGDYKLRDSFHINRSRVQLIGESDVRLRLASGVQTPVLSVGSLSSYPLEEERISDVSIANLTIDGNRDRQESEYHHDLPWIRNNGIDVRVVTGLLVENVDSSNNRSGGLVISWRCRDVLVKNSVFDRNFFDGVAYYDSSAVITVDCKMRENRGAGISLDNRFEDSAFVRCELLNNGDVGVFARNSKRLVFFESRIADSGSWAMFLGHDEEGRGVFDLEIASCTISGNNGGVRMGSVYASQSENTVLASTSFTGNDRGGRGNVSTAGSSVDIVEGAWSAAGESKGEKGDRELPISDRIYQVLSEIGERDQG